MRNKIYKKRKNSILKIINEIVQFIAAFCTVSGISVCGSKSIMSVKFDNINIIQEEQKQNILVNYIFDNWLMFIAITFVALLIIKSCGVPLYKIYVKDVPPEEAKPYFLEIIFLSIMSVLAISCSAFTTTAKASFPLVEREEVDCDVDGDGEDLHLTKEEVEVYIIRCNKEILSISEWRKLAQDDLFYIRNGIFAYHGRMFLETYLVEYFCEFDWYNPRYTPSGVWKYINYLETKNIENIHLIEVERGYY